MALVDAAICFFIPFYATRSNARSSATDVFSVGKTVFIALLGSVTLEVALVSRYWTWLFVAFLLLSYFLVYPFEVRRRALLTACSSPLPAAGMVEASVYLTG